MSQPEAVVIGAGGHAKVAIATLQAAGVKVSAVYDDDKNKWGKEILGVPVKGGLSLLQNSPSLSAFIAVGNNFARKKISERFKLNWLNAIHPTAVVHESVHLGEGILIAAGVVVQPDVTIGSYAILNTSCRVDHDCTIGAYSHIAPGVSLAGEIRVGERTLIGVGTAIKPGIQIGSDAIVGAGSCVVKDVKDGETVAGNPAKSL